MLKRQVQEAVKTAIKDLQADNDLKIMSAVKAATDELERKVQKLEDDAVAEKTALYRRLLFTSLEQTISYLALLDASCGCIRPAVSKNKAKIKYVVRQLIPSKHPDSVVKFLLEHRAHAIHAGDMVAHPSVNLADIEGILRGGAVGPLSAEDDFLLNLFVHARRQLHALDSTFAIDGTDTPYSRDRHLTALNFLSVQPNLP